MRPDGLLPDVSLKGGNIDIVKIDRRHKGVCIALNPIVTVVDTILSPTSRKPGMTYFSTLSLWRKVIINSANVSGEPWLYLWSRIRLFLPSSLRKSPLRTVNRLAKPL